MKRHIFTGVSSFLEEEPVGRMEGRTENKGLTTKLWYFLSVCSYALVKLRLNSSDGFSRLIESALQVKSRPLGKLSIRAHDLMASALFLLVRGTLLAPFAELMPA